MFEILEYEVSFSNGRTIKNRFDFDTGLTAIFGANGCGKSVSLEMIRFCLYGSGALRGKTTEYESIKAKLGFKGHQIERTLKQAKISRGSEVIATGTTAVNAKVVSILGFSLAVFDVACAANQGDLERLSSMPPTERKRMIDSVIGIGALEVVAKWAGEEALIRTKEAAGIRSAITKPVLPELPEGYRPTREIEAEIEPLRAQAKELSEIDGFLRVQLERPIEPVCPVEQSVAELEPLAAEQRQLRQDQSKLKSALAGLPASVMSEEAIEELEARIVAYEAWEANKAWLRLHPKPPHCTTVLEPWASAWVTISTNEMRRNLEQNIRSALSRGAKPCPHCGEDIPLEEDRIRGYKKELEALGEMVQVEVPPLEEKATHQALRDWRDFLPIAEEWMQRSARREPPKPVADRGRLEQEKRNRKAAESRGALQAALDGIVLSDEDYEGMCARRRAYDAALTTYQRSLGQFEAWEIKRCEAEARRGALLHAPAALENLNLHLRLASIYESQLLAYQRDLLAWTEQAARAEKLEADADQYRKVKEAMGKLRTMVKQHLLPSLNMVASKLLSDMTGGQRNIIYIDDDFNIAVDGQSVDTLSGSEKACANLAMRIGLGQVLTHKSLSVFLADEIDASMDSFRAGETSKTLRALQKRISQIILVSHKQIEADHCFDLTPSVPH